MQPPGRYYAAVYETRLVENEEMTIVAAPVKVEIFTGPAHVYRLSNHQAVVPLKGELDEEVEIPSPPPIDFESGKRYIMVATHTRKHPASAEVECGRIVDRITGIVSILTTPTLFARPIYTGWVGLTPSAPVNTQLMFSKPERLHGPNLEKGISVARSVLAQDATMRDRFDLVARLFNRSIGMAPSDEAFLWAWTCLEVFPMCGTQKYKHVAPYLAKITGFSESEVLTRVDIRALHVLRSKLVHSGRLGLTAPELYSNLSLIRGVVYTVMRGMCGLPYDGELDRVASKSGT
jgi:hypothetical protein